MLNYLYLVNEVCLYCSRIVATLARFRCQVTTMYISLSSHDYVNFVVKSRLCKFHCQVTTMYISLSSHDYVYFVVKSRLCIFRCQVTTM